MLVENALTHGAGSVRIAVRTTPSGGGSMAVVEVSDEGPGIPDALVPHIFDRGVSTASSTGIGLGLARAFVEADGGRLELRRASPPVFAVFLAVDRECCDGRATSAAPTRSADAAVELRRARPVGRPAAACRRPRQRAGSWA